MKNEACLFCKIVEHGIPSEVIYENDLVFAFLDINPINKGHTLVIPKAHAENIYDIAQEDFAAVMETVRRLAPIVKRAVNAGGINIGMNNGAIAGQLIPHAHVHIIPRFDGDGFKHWHGIPPQDGELTAIREHIVREIE